MIDWLSLLAVVHGHLPGDEALSGEELKLARAFKTRQARRPVPGDDGMDFVASAFLINQTNRGSKGVSVGANNFRTSHPWERSTDCEPVCGRHGKIPATELASYLNDAALLVRYGRLSNRSTRDSCEAQFCGCAAKFGLRHVNGLSLDGCRSRR